MPESPLQDLQDVIDGLRARLQAELDAQLGAISERHGQALARARQDAEQVAEQRWAARLESTRSEWSARLASEVDNARADAERRLVAEAMRVRVEAEQAAAETAARAREELDARLADERRHAEQMMDAERAAAQARFDAELEAAQARIDAERAAAQAKIEAEHEAAKAKIDAERAEAQARLETERERAEAQLAADRERADRAVAEARAALDDERQSASAQLAAAPVADAGRLLDALASIDRASSLSDVLALTAAATALEAPRAALFIINGPQLEEWHVPAVPAISPGLVGTRAPEAGILGQAITSGAVTRTQEGIAAPAFARLPDARDAIAVPLMLGDEAVGVLYADEAGEGEVPPAWRHAVEILGRHASARLAYLTAVRTADAVRLMRGEGSAPADDDLAARRYARLLVSEIKLYNEAAVRAGREKRDLLRRLRPEIDRARRLYDERVPASIPDRDACFQQELVQTLADGDAALLG